MAIGVQCCFELRFVVVPSFVRWPDSCDDVVLVHVECIFQHERWDGGEGVRGGYKWWWRNENQRGEKALTYCDSAAACGFGIFMAIIFVGYCMQMLL